MKVIINLCLFMFLALLFGCGHEQVSRIGLLSFGNLEGKIIPDKVNGKVVTGESCGAPFVGSYYLSDAFRDAIKETNYDTLLDVELINTTGLLVTSNCIILKGTAIDSKTLAVTVGGNQ